MSDITINSPLAIGIPGPQGIQGIPGTSSAGGIGPFTLVPSGSANGTPIGTPPIGVVYVRFYLNPGDSVTFTVATSQPVSTPTTYQITYYSAGQFWQEAITLNANVYITAITGAPLYRFL